MNYTKVLYLLKRGNHIKHSDNVNMMNTYFSYDFNTGLITVEQYNIETVGNFWAMYLHNTFDMTVIEFISYIKENEIKFDLS